VAPARKALDVHLPAGHLDRLDDQFAVEDGPPREGDDDALRDQERPVAGLEPLDHEIAELELPGAEQRADAPDRHRAVEPGGAAAFGFPLEVGPQVDREERDDQRRDDGGDEGERVEPDPADA
jgi:hypothetical protein